MSRTGLIRRLIQSRKNIEQFPVWIKPFRRGFEIEAPTSARTCREDDARSATILMTGSRKYDFI